MTAINQKHSVTNNKSESNVFLRVISNWLSDKNSKQKLIQEIESKSCSLCYQEKLINLSKEINIANQKTEMYFDFFKKQKYNRHIKF